jgi:hypothetical protein
VATRLIAGVRYYVNLLDLSHWIDASGKAVAVSGSHHYVDYFTDDGEFKGPDVDDIEPVFHEASIDVENATWGDLMDYERNAYIRPATKEERDESLNSGPEGVFRVGRKSVYVQE